MSKQKLSNFGWLGLLVGIPLLAWLSYQLIHKNIVQTLQTQTQLELDLFTDKLKNEVEKFSFLPTVVAQSELVQRALVKQTHVNSIQGNQGNALNQYLEYVNEASNTVDIYLLDASGLTIAASNWNKGRTFIGKNFSFRPYFKQAITGQQGRYFALGVASGARGYYFSSPVFDSEKHIVGVLVVKLSIDKIEASWSDFDLKILVADQYGVVFSSNEPSWHFLTIGELGEEGRSKIKQDQQYPLEILKPLLHGNVQALVPQAIVEIDQLYVGRSVELPDLDWQVYGLARFTPAKQRIMFLTVVTVVFSLLLWALLMGFFWRRRELSEQSAFRNRTELALMQARDRLEIRVKERTKELSYINQNLETEIAERKLAEERLRETQNELVHATKLATLGHLSAGISHELNQPLTAIGHFADNALAFSAQKRVEAVDENLHHIVRVTENMARITTHLKAFARKTDDAVGTVSLKQVTQNAHALLQLRMAEMEIQVEMNLIESANVAANEVRLEQVFINLLNNALDAMQDVDDKRLLIVQSRENEMVHTQIHDSGLGIQADFRGKVFESFYTTKPVGVGLGLGLSISYNIVQRFGGNITVTKSKYGGACFTVSLREKHV